MIEDKELDSDDNRYCIFCKDFTMELSENELVYECSSCGDWEYSSS